MSLETAIAELSATVAKNNELLAELISRAKSPAPAAAAPSATAAAAPSATAEDEPEEKPKRTRRTKAEEAAPAEKKAEEPAPVEKKAEKKALTVDDIRAAIGGFLDTEDTDIREQRKQFVKSMLDHFGVGKAVEIAEEDRAQAIKWVNDKAAGKKVNFQADDESADEEEDDDMLG